MGHDNSDSKGKRRSESSLDIRIQEMAPFPVLLSRRGAATGVVRRFSHGKDASIDQGNYLVKEGEEEKISTHLAATTPG